MGEGYLGSYLLKEIIQSRNTEHWNRSLFSKASRRDQNWLSQSGGGSPVESVMDFNNLYWIFMKWGPYSWPFFLPSHGRPFSGSSSYDPLEKPTREGHQNHCKWYCNEGRFIWGYRPIIGEHVFGEMLCCLSFYQVGTASLQLQGDLSTRVFLPSEDTALK